MAEQGTLPTPAVAAFCAGDPFAVAVQLEAVVAATPEHAREFARRAAQAVAETCCEHDTAPLRLPNFAVLADAVQAAQDHEGLCGLHQANVISSISTSGIRARGPLPTGKKLRNQVRRRPVRYSTVP